MTDQSRQRPPSLLLVRHGQTSSNVSGALDTALPGAALTEMGRQQATQLGGQLAQTGVRPAQVISSEAARAQQTARLLAHNLSVPSSTVAGAHEVQAGEFEMRHDAEALGAYVGMLHAWLIEGKRDHALPGGESAEQVRDRILPVVTALGDELRTPECTSDAVLVVHGTLMRLVAVFLNTVPAQWAMINRIPNCGVIELQPTDAGWSCTRWGNAEDIPNLS